MNLRTLQMVSKITASTSNCEIPLTSEEMSLKINKLNQYPTSPKMIKQGKNYLVTQGELVISNDKEVVTLKAGSLIQLLPDKIFRRIKMKSKDLRSSVGLPIYILQGNTDHPTPIRSELKIGSLKEFELSKALLTDLDNIEVNGQSIPSRLLVESYVNPLDLLMFDFFAPITKRSSGDLLVLFSLTTELTVQGKCYVKDKDGSWVAFDTLEINTNFKEVNNNIEVYTIFDYQDNLSAKLLALEPDRTKRKALCESLFAIAGTDVLANTGYKMHCIAEYMLEDLNTVIVNTLTELALSKKLTIGEYNKLISQQYILN